MVDAAGSHVLDSRITHAAELVRRTTATPPAAQTATQERPSAPLRIVVVDEYEVVRAGLFVAFLAEADMVVVGVTTNGAHALELSRQRRADIVVVGSSVADMSTIALCRRLRAQHQSLTVVLLTAVPSGDLPGSTGPVRAHACVTQSAGLAELKRVMRLAFQGNTDRGRAAHAAGQHTDHDHDPHALTPQQHAVARLAVRGLTNREIGARLFITESTVRFHLQNLKQRLGARNKVEVITRILQEGLLDAAAWFEPGPSLGRHVEARQEA